MTTETYLRLYDAQEERVAEALHRSDTLLGDYPNRSVWTTWNISYEAILGIDKDAARLLILWSFLDRKDLWYGLFEEASPYESMADNLSNGLGAIAMDELAFIDAMSLLRSYSLIEGSEHDNGYTMHTVVHRWLYFYHGTKHRSDLGLLALKVIGYAVPMTSERDYARLQQRLLPHANMCLKRIADIEESSVPIQTINYNNESRTHKAHDDECTDAIHNLGLFYRNQGKLNEAEEMYDRALGRYEKAFGAEHMSTLNTVNDLGILYCDQAKLGEAEKMFERALRGKEKGSGAEHISTLDTVNNLGLVYCYQNKLAEAEKMCERALGGYEKAFGAEHISTLDTVNNLGILYAGQGKLAEAEEMFERALRGKETAFGAEHTLTLDTVNNLGILYKDQGKLDEAEKMYEQALRVRQKAFGAEHVLTLNIVHNLGSLYLTQGRLDEAEKMYERALRGHEKALGPEVVKTFISALETMWCLGDLCILTNRLDRSRDMYERALSGYVQVQGASADVCLTLTKHLEALTLVEKSNQQATDFESSRLPEREQPEKAGTRLRGMLQKIKI